MNSDNIKVHDVVRIRPSDRGYRVWKVTAVLLGAVRQESHIQLEPLDFTRGTDDDGNDVDCLVPFSMFNALNGLEIIKRP